MAGLEKNGRLDVFSKYMKGEPISVTNKQRKSRIMGIYGLKKQNKKQPSDALIQNVQAQRVNPIPFSAYSETTL